MIDNDVFLNECTKFLHNSIGNKFLTEDKSPLYDDLLIGYQNANHPIFNQISNIIPEHLKPLDFIPEFLISNDVNKIELSVISFSFVFNKRTVKENSLSESYPSFSWYNSTYKFSEFLTIFREYIKDFFINKNVRYVFPNTVKEKYQIILKNGIKYSNWSERHIAYACGLGSFGLHGSLITSKGCTHRLMSVIIDQSFKRYCEPDQPWNKNCLLANGIKCGACISKCPVDSIRMTGRSIIECIKHESITNKETSKRLFGHEMEACGLCMCGVPCSTINPMSKRIN